MGLELLGAVGEAEVQQAVCLAAQSLAALGAEWVLEVSHMGYLFGLFDALGVPDAARAKLLEKLREKNAHELRAAAREYRPAPDLHTIDAEEADDEQGIEVEVIEEPAPEE